MALLAIKETPHKSQEVWRLLQTVISADKSQKMIHFSQFLISHKNDPVLLHHGDFPFVSL